MAGKDALGIIIDLHGFAFETGRSFRGITISETLDGFNCVIRARESSGAPVYALTAAEDPQRGLERLWRALASGNGESLWRHDRFATQRETA